MRFVIYSSSKDTFLREAAIREKKGLHLKLHPCILIHATGDRRSNLLHHSIVYCYIIFAHNLQSLVFRWQSYTISFNLATFSPFFFFLVSPRPHAPRCISMVIDYSAPAVKKIIASSRDTKTEKNRRFLRFSVLSPCPGEG